MHVAALQLWTVDYGLGRKARQRQRQTYGYSERAAWEPFYGARGVGVGVGMRCPSSSCPSTRSATLSHVSAFSAASHHPHLTPTAFARLKSSLRLCRCCSVLPSIRSYLYDERTTLAGPPSFPFHGCPNRFRDRGCTNQRRTESDPKPWIRNAIDHHRCEREKSKVFPSVFCLEPSLISQTDF